MSFRDFEHETFILREEGSGTKQEKMCIRDSIKTDEDMHTNVEGVYAVGDIRVKSLRQVVTAAADGAIASMQVEKWLAEQK